MNLLTNAVDSLKSLRGTIEVSTQIVVAGGVLPKSLQLENDCDYAVIYVTDTGCGISESARARIFDPFYTTKGQGHGIGLAAVAGIVKDHSGDITFDSRLSVGTSFTVALPLTHVEDDVPGLTNRTSPDVERLNVLLVDDDELVLTSMRMLLEAAGVLVTTSDCGSDALAIAEQRDSSFDVILLDQTMPGMSGLETCRMLRQRGVDSPVVLMSGFSEVNIDKSLDGVHFLGKPCSRTQLIDVLGNATGSRGVSQDTPERQAG